MFNRLLNLLDTSDKERLLPLMEEVDMPRLLVLAKPNEAQEYSYFPETGIGSIMAVSKRTRG